MYPLLRTHHRPGRPLPMTTEHAWTRGACDSGPSIPPHKTRLVDYRLPWGGKR